MLLNRPISIFYFLNQIKYQIFFILVFAVLIGFLDDYYMFRTVTIPVGVTAVFGTSISLLLAFRISQSYERWWEARIIWGAIVNDSRTLIRQAIEFLPDHQKEEITIMAERQIIWNYALGESLRRLNFSDSVQAYLDRNGITAANIPNALLSAHTLQLKRWAANGWISEFRMVQIDSTLVRLCDAMGKCERIKNTVFPRSYSTLVHFIIYLFAVFLPFGLEDANMLSEILLTIIIPCVFIALETTAILMQDPFENAPLDTPMTSLAQTIEINIRQMTGVGAIPVKQDTGLYYEM